MKLRSGIIACLILAAIISLHAQDTFQTSYSASGDESIEWLIPANEGNLILAGNTNSFDASGDGLIIKTDQDGNIIWSKLLGGSGWDEIVRIISCNGGGYAAVGYTDSYGQGGRDAWITRIDEDGEVIWSSCFGTYSNDAARAILQTADGGFIVVGQEVNFDYAFMIALNSDGELLWKKEFYLDIVIWFNGIIEDGFGGYLLTGALNYDGFGIHDTFIMRTDAYGNILRSKVYGAQNNDSFRTLIPYGDGFLAAGDSWSWGGSPLAWATLLTVDLEIEKSVVFGDINASQFFESACIISNSIYANVKLTNGSAYIVELDSALNLRNSWQFNPGLHAYSSHMISLEDNSLIFAGSVTDTETLHKDAYLVKFMPGDTAYNCNSVQHTTYLNEVNVQRASLNVVVSYAGSDYELIGCESVNTSFQTHALCSTLPPVAEFSSPYIICAREPFNVIDSSMYGDTYHWVFSGAIPSTSDDFDPGIIVYENPGMFSIKLVVSNQSGADSLTRYILVWPLPEVYLGPDTSLTYDTQLILDAGPGMDHYLWQDGSNGQTFEVTENGTYWVIVQKDYCFASDTVKVSPQLLSSNPHDVLLYPNPAKESVRVASYSGEIPATVNIYNYTRTKVISLDPLTDVIDISYLEPGFYIIEMKFREATVIKRLLVI